VRENPERRKKRGMREEPCKAMTHPWWYLGSPKQWKMTIHIAAAPLRPTWAERSMGKGEREEKEGGGILGCG
jgi:hypothetical protein